MPTNFFSKISEAIEIKNFNAKVNGRGKVVLKKEIASRLWPNVDNENHRQVNLHNLLRGRTQKINPDWVAIICEMCDTTPNFLFGFETINTQING